MIQWTLHLRKISELKPHPRNPRVLSEHDAEHLQKSLDKFGMIDKPIITKDNRIIGGHQRISLLKKKKIKEVECWMPDQEISDKDIDELCIRLNRNLGEWDYDILANQWDENEILSYGFTQEELSINLSDSDPLPEDDEPLTPPKDEDAITKLGDRYFFGGHTLVCGDSILPETVSLCLGSHKPVLMVTDPPYGVNYDPAWREDSNRKHGGKTLAIGKVKNDDQVNWSLAWHLFPGSVAYIWHSSKFCAEVEKSLTDSEYEIISQIIWVKQHFALSRGDYHWQHEPCWYAVKKGCPHNWQGARDQATIWEISNLNAFGKSQDDERTAHSTQKPLECMTRPIKNNSAVGDGVYDPFGGSGTTVIAAEMHQRVCYMIELSPAYCDIIVRRWINYRKKNGKDATVKKNDELTEEFCG